MKSTQKKLKAKHFRYLSKEYVQDPDRFLREVVHLWGLNWSNNFNYLINSSIYPPMRSETTFDYGFVQVHIGQMIEVAHVIMKRCGFQPTCKGRIFQYSCKEMLAVIEEDRIFPEKIICDFFGFKTLQEWLFVLNDFLTQQDYTVSDIHQIQLSLEYVPKRELLVKLPRALQEIYDRGGLKHCLPDTTE